MEQEPLLVGAVERIDILLVLAGAEGRHHERLRLAPGEERGAVGARQHADLRQDRPDGRQVATVDAPAVVEDVPAHDLGLGVVDRLGDFGGGKLGVPAFRREGGRHLGLDGVDRRIALLLLGQRIGRPEIGLADLEHRLLDLGAVACGKVARLLGRLLGQANDRGNDRLEAGVAGHDGLQHHLFAELLSLRLDHQHGVGGAGDDEIESRILHVLDHRVDPDFPFDQADPGRADRAHEGHARQRERRRGGDHGENVGIRLEVIGEHSRDDLRVAAELVGKERADRTVDQPRCQGLALGGPAFALEVAAGNATGGEGLLLIMDGEGEKVLAGLGGLLRNDRGEHGGLAPGRQHGAVSLTGDAAGFQHELAPAPVEFFALNIKHLSSSWVRMRKPAVHAARFLRARHRQDGWRLGGKVAPAPGDPAMTRGLRMSNAGRRPLPPPDWIKGAPREASLYGSRLSGGCRGARSETCNGLRPAS